MDRLSRFSTHLVGGFLALTFLALTLYTATHFSGSEAQADELPPAPDRRDPLPFPSRGLLPKHEIGATRFLQKYPQFDGRGIVVAIFDTGVDPGASGLQTTSDGQPKIVDMIDGTGSGDVDTSTIQQASAGVLQGLSGRELTLHPDWVADKRSFHLGLKAGYQFFPPALVSRLKSERKQGFLAHQRSAETQLRRQIETLRGRQQTASPGAGLRASDLRERLRQLRLASQEFVDAGPVFDCVVFHDGTHWRAVVDTDEDGNLAEEKPLTNFRDERGFATFSGGANLNFSVNIFAEGNRLSIVTTSDPHGTHVAGIVAAHFPEQPELSGIAPGAQIVSIKIGDTRLGNMETASGLERGVIATVTNQCDLVNMSFGEPTRSPNRGWLSDLFSQLVDDYGVIFVAAAMNAGPALSTVGAPGATTASLFGVGAYLSPTMMKAQYAVLETRPELPYTFTSRGPTFDGDLGVRFCAPGGAIAPVPVWTRNFAMQMNGTSMASPNACGAIALLLSAAKSQGVRYTPTSIRRALENTAQPIADYSVFSQGRGLIQVDHAWQHLLAHRETTAGLSFSVRISGHGNARGFYLREAEAVRRVTDSQVSIQPIFPKKTSTLQRAQFQLRLRVETTQPWIRAASHLLLHHRGSRFRVAIDPRHLPGGAHYGEIRLSPLDRPGHGPLVRIPVTAIVPNTGGQTGAKHEETLALQAGAIHRRFLTVPAAARWMDLQLERSAGPGRRRVVVHTVQKRDDHTFRNGQYKRYHTFVGSSLTRHRIPVEAGRMLELCIAQDWWSKGDTKLTYTASFRGPTPEQQSLSRTHHGPPLRVRVNAGLEPTVIEPRAELTDHRQTVHPSEARVRPLSSQRDRLPDGRQIYQLLLTYEFKIPIAGFITPRCPTADDRLYEAVHGVPFWMLFDEHHRLLAADDMWPSPVRLERGDYVLQLQLRHPDPDALENLKRATLWLDRKLSRGVPLPIFADRGAADRNGPRMTSRTLERGATLAFTLGALPPSALPPHFGPGDMLLGRIHYARPATQSLRSARHPEGYPLMYYGDQSPSLPIHKAEPVPKNASDLAARRWTFELEQLRRLIDTQRDELFENLASQLLEQRPEGLAVRVARLHRLDRAQVRKQQLDKVVAAADAILDRINRGRLARYFGTASKTGRADKPALHEQRTRERERLIDALYRKGRALAYMELPDVVKTHPIKNQRAHNRAFETNFQQLAKWVDTTDRKYCLLHVRRDRRQQRYGAALRLLNQQIRDGNANYWFFKKRRDLYELSGWQHLRDYEHRWLLLRFPSQRLPF